VRDEDDDEIKKYTHDKDIVEILVEKENHIVKLENMLHKLMVIPLAFLRQINLVNHTMQPRFLNTMNLLKIQD
jgi:ERCC4-related helicase